MQRTSAYPRIINLGSVNMTNIHDFRQVCYVAMMALATLTFLVWSHFNGLLAHVHEQMGPMFTIGFALLLTAGFSVGLAETLNVSRGINSIKSVGSANNEVLRQMFGFSNDFTKVDAMMLKEEIADYFALRTDKVQHVANLATVLGLFGTAYGLSLAFESVEHVRSSEDVFARLPEIASSLAVAFYTTLVGIAVYVVINQVHRALRAATVELQNRIFRSLHELAQ